MRAFTFYLGIFTNLFGIICAMFQLQPIFRIAAAILVTIAVVLVLKYSKCSHCGSYQVRLNPFSRKFGVCKKCNHKEQ